MISNVEVYLEVIEQTLDYECEYCAGTMNHRRITFVNKSTKNVLLECKPCGTAVSFIMNR
ncbi:hypothetical protein [Halobacillus litoralis]|uniref:hypothetical protein n=1 Tax=Halobacillus litoralis TaxID=45668 RepID=UPI0024905C2D|nr:hypothetical protein [Halobacillus litoralis]